MAETSRPGPGGRPNRGRVATVWAGVLAFAGILGVLAVRLAEGDDPALRARLAAVPAAPRRVLVRRIEIRRVVHHLPPTASARPTSATSNVAGSARWNGPSVTRAS
jgi:hypothetical protein